MESDLVVVIDLWLKEKGFRLTKQNGKSFQLTKQNNQYLFEDTTQWYYKDSLVFEFCQTKFWILDGLTWKTLLISDPNSFDLLSKHIQCKIDFHNLTG